MYGATIPGCNNDEGKVIKRHALNDSVRMIIESGLKFSAGHESIIRSLEDKVKATHEEVDQALIAAGFSEEEVMKFNGKMSEKSPSFSGPREENKYSFFEELKDMYTSSYNSSFFQDKDLSPPLPPRIVESTLGEKLSQRSSQFCKN